MLITGATGRRKASKIAMCPRCKDVLVCTFAFRKYEFYCLRCGWLGGWLDPNAATETPTRLARMETVKAEWAPFERRLLTTDKFAHASAEEKQAHTEAVKELWLRAAKWRPRRAS